MVGYINYMDTYSKITVTITLGQNYFLGNLHGQEKGKKKKKKDRIVFVPQ